MIPSMIPWLAVLILLQDPGDEIRALLRRLESGPPAETAELILRLDQAVDRAEPRVAASVLAEALRADRLPAARRLDLAETLHDLRDDSWIEEAGRIALDDSEAAETRMRAALLMGRAGAPRAEEVGRTLDERLFAEATDDAARALGTHLREGTSREQQRREIDFLMRLPRPAARAALREALFDDQVDAVIRLEIAERLHSAGGFDRVRDARAALERIRKADPGLAARVDRLHAAFRGIRESPSSSLSDEAPAEVPAAAGPREERRSRAGRVNLYVGAGTILLLAALLGWKRKG
jgi:hypothetical protein